MVVPPVPSRFLRVILVTSVTNDKGDNEMIPGVVHRSFGKTIARRPSDEGTVEPVIASNGVPFLQMSWVGSFRKGEGRK